MKQEDHDKRVFALQLYEKGLLSPQTLLKEFDIDYDKEVENMRKDAETNKPDTTVLDARDVRVFTSDKIEQARRNAEIILRYYGQRDYQELKDQFKKILDESFGVMKLVSQI